ncbi:MAG: hypothetical protein KDJ75_00845 [Alphaproteobacteria bacterium]|nr:hypothetical protein [Alphaproteobacteria bacterium]
MDIGQKVKKIFTSAAQWIDSAVDLCIPESVVNFAEEDSGYKFSSNDR